VINAASASREHGRCALNLAKSHDQLIGTNALASSIDSRLPQARGSDAPTVSRRDFLRELNATLPEALARHDARSGVNSPVAPVDLSQAIIGPGMAIFSQIRRRARGRRHAHERAHCPPTHQPLPGRGRLRRRHASSACTGSSSTAGTRASYGEADVLARAKGTSVDGVKSGRRGGVRRRQRAPAPLDGVPDRLGPASGQPPARYGKPYTT
jgi:putative DNA methylase